MCIRQRTCGAARVVSVWVQQLGAEAWRSATATATATVATERNAQCWGRSQASEQSLGVDFVTDARRRAVGVETILVVHCRSFVVRPKRIIQRFISREDCHRGYDGPGHRQGNANH